MRGDMDYKNWSFGDWVAFLLEVLIPTMIVTAYIVARIYQ
jgi:hypothetical protein